MPYQLAQLNIAKLLAPLESAQLADFVAAIAGVNALADRAPGFVWRMIDEPGDTRPAQLFGPNVVVNLSVWEDLAALQSFAFRSGHADVLRQRRQWFEPMKEAYLALWWVPAGHQPSLEEAAGRLASLRQRGPTMRAFGFSKSFPVPEGTAP
jgi:heme-degrading monooxygenase HmoA